MRRKQLPVQAPFLPQGHAGWVPASLVTSNCLLKASVDPPFSGWASVIPVTFCHLVRDFWALCGNWTAKAKPKRLIYVWYWDSEGRVACWQPRAAIQNTEHTLWMLSWYHQPSPELRNTWFKPTHRKWRTVVLHLCGDGACAVPKVPSWVTCKEPCRAEGQTAVESNFCHWSAIQQSLFDWALTIKNSSMVRKVHLVCIASWAGFHHNYSNLQEHGFLSQKQPLELQIDTYRGGKWFAGKQITLRESTLHENKRKTCLTLISRKTPRQQPFTI